MSIHVFPSASLGSPPEKPRFFNIRRDKSKRPVRLLEERRTPIQAEDEEFRARWWPGAEPFPENEDQR